MLNPAERLLEIGIGSLHGFSQLLDSIGLKRKKIGQDETGRLEFLYHGSHQQGLRMLEPNESGYGKKYVYGTDSLSSAVIFLGRGRNSFEASWTMGGKDQYFCERKYGILDRWYSGVRGSVYVLSPSDFQKDERVSEHEFISSRPVRILEETKVADAKAFLLDLERQGKIEIIQYKDRMTKFPDDSDLVEMCLNGLGKYSVEFTLKRIRKLQPQIEKEFLEKAQRRMTGL